jgi:hypothetical protein
MIQPPWFAGTTIDSELSLHLPWRTLQTHEKTQSKTADCGTETRSKHLTQSTEIPPSQPALSFPFEGAKMDPTPSQVNWQKKRISWSQQTTCVGATVRVRVTGHITVCALPSAFYHGSFCHTDCHYRTHPRDEPMNRLTATNTKWTLVAWGGTLFLKDQNILSSPQCHYFYETFV